MNLYYDLPHDVRRVIDKMVKDMENRDALLNELKAFDRMAWSKERHKRGKFPYLQPFINPDAIDMMHCIEYFYDFGGGYCDYIDGVYGESLDNIYGFYM